MNTIFTLVLDEFLFSEYIFLYTVYNTMFPTCTFTPQTPQSWTFNTSWNDSYRVSLLAVVPCVVGNSLFPKATKIWGRSDPSCSLERWSAAGWTSHSLRAWPDWFSICGPATERWIYWAGGLKPWHVLIWFCGFRLRRLKPTGRTIASHTSLKRFLQSNKKSLYFL